MGDPADEAPAFTLPPWSAAAPARLPNVELRAHFDIPRLEWRPIQAPAPEPGFDSLSDPVGAVDATHKYILNGSLFFAMQTPNWQALDLAFLRAPMLPPPLLPTTGEIKSLLDDSFFRGLGRPTSLLPPLDNSKGNFLKLPSLAGPSTPYFSYPQPTPPWGEERALKPGSIGDVLGAIYKLKPIQERVKLLETTALAKVEEIKRKAWDEASFPKKFLEIGLGATLAAGVVGTVLGVDDARHLAFKKLVGVNIPVPWVEGLSVHINDYGPLDQPLTGAASLSPNKPASVDFGLRLDLLKMFKGVRRAF
jgi:hypothetical protein